MKKTSTVSHSPLTEDVRFARTIERIQRTVISELTKIIIVHLYSQGITDSEMTNFELGLVNPSTIYEQEKVNLWSEKIRLDQDIQSLICYLKIGFTKIYLNYQKVNLMKKELRC